MIGRLMTHLKQFCRCICVLQCCLTINDSDYENKYTVASQNTTPSNNSNSNPFEKSFKKNKQKQIEDTESNTSHSSQLSAVSINCKINELESLLS